MRGLVSFALGLWSGGLVVGALWIFYFRTADRPVEPPASPSPSSASTIVSAEEMRQLRQDNALLGAEIDRLRESLQESQASRTRAEQQPQPPAVTRPMTDRPQRVVPGQPISLGDLERMAADNDRAALENLLASAGDGQRTVLRLWRSPRLSEANRALVGRYLGGLTEALLAEQGEAGVTEESALDELPLGNEPAPLAE